MTREVEDGPQVKVTCQPHRDGEGSDRQCWLCGNGRVGGRTSSRALPRARPRFLGHRFGPWPDVSPRPCFEAEGPQLERVSCAQTSFLSGTVSISTRPE